MNVTFHILMTVMKIQLVLTPLVPMSVSATLASVATELIAQVGKSLFLFNYSFMFVTKSRY